LAGSSSSLGDGHLVYRVSASRVCPNLMLLKQLEELRGAPSSWVEPVLELNLEAPEHLFFDALNVRELAPTSQGTVLGRSLNLYDELFHQSQLVGVFFPQIRIRPCRARESKSQISSPSGPNTVATTTARSASTSVLRAIFLPP
jgi:hypothetical protein